VAPDLDGGQRKKVMEAQGKLYEAKYLESVTAFPRRAVVMRRNSMWRGAGARAGARFGFVLLVNPASAALPA
jgi:hypothetical protein